MKAGPFLTLVLFGIILIANFLYWSRSAKWYAVRKAFPLDASTPMDESLRLQYGNANVCGHYMRNAVFSGTLKAGIVIRKPFPFSCLMPPIFIPWSAVEQIIPVSNLEAAPASTPAMDPSPPEYAKIEFKAPPGFVIIIPWQPGYRTNLPEGRDLIK